MKNKYITTHDAKICIKGTVKANSQAKELVNTLFVSDTNVVNKKYTLNDLKTQKLAVHLPTQEENDRFMEFIKKRGLEKEVYCFFCKLRMLYYLEL